MIHHLRGILHSKGNLLVVLDVGGVGYGVTVPLTTLSRLDEPGSTVSLHIHTEVREDAIELFGFSEEGERTAFRLLRSVQGIGPRMAVNILSRLSVEELVAYIRHEDAVALSRTPGIGPKRAGKIILDLKDRLLEVGLLPEKDLAGRNAEDGDLLLALLGLGYSRAQAEKAIAALPQNDRGSLEDSLRATLKTLSRF
ncbi:MAG: Holliday junction DNA helicase RuvA [Deltaproteobacteria bacterium RIFOXYA12_FULL_61_11]|nr:MAG: Holliday junction DNA helicase RuvA [Deltaproteobacteria bacterium RIFOXYA12_FULL_61_11]